MTTLCESMCSNAAVVIICLRHCRSHNNYFGVSNSLCFISKAVRESFCSNWWSWQEKKTENDNTIGLAAVKNGFSDRCMCACILWGSKMLLGLGMTMCLHVFLMYASSKAMTTGKILLINGNKCMTMVVWFRSFRFIAEFLWFLFQTGNYTDLTTK